MRRIGLAVVLALSLTLAPLVAEAQQTGKKVWLIGYLSPAEGHNPIDETFERSMKGLGYVDGQNIRLERRYTAGRPERLASAAAELVRLNADLIVVWSPGATGAVKDATSTIPVVFLAGAIKYKSLATNLPYAGGNLTGITFEAGDVNLEPKYLEMLKELVPKLSQVVLLRVPGEERSGEGQNIAAISNRKIGTAAQALGIRLSIIELRGPEDLETAFAKIERDRPQALIATPTGLLVAHGREVIAFAAKNRLPAVYGFRELVAGGGLMSLSASLSDIAARGASYVDKILKGAKPADLPIEQPTKFELVINLKTAKALGLTIPQTLLLRADEVFE